MNEKIIKTIESLDIRGINDERKQVLTPLIELIQKKVDNNQNIDLNFICTHNSRRSHLSQIWAQTLANYFKIQNVFCYSGGTEATALFPKVAETLKNQGFDIHVISDGNNPVYSIKYDINSQPIVGFSKEYNAEFNPKSNYIAIMTCDSANEACPIVFGAEARIPIMFKDPKSSDGTPDMDKIYSERSLEIASEMYFVFSNIKQS